MLTTKLLLRHNLLVPMKIGQVPVRHMRRFTGYFQRVSQCSHSSHKGTQGYHTGIARPRKPNLNEKDDSGKIHDVVRTYTCGKPNCACQICLSKDPCAQDATKNGQYQDKGHLSSSKAIPKKTEVIRDEEGKIVKTVKSPGQENPHVKEKTLVGKVAGKDRYLHDYQEVETKNARDPQNIAYDLKATQQFEENKEMSDKVQDVLQK